MPNGDDDSFDETSASRGGGDSSGAESSGRSPGAPALAGPEESGLPAPTWAGAREGVLPGTGTASGAPAAQIDRDRPGFNWKRLMNPLISAAVVYGGSRASGANQGLAGGAGVLAGLLNVPGVDPNSPLGAAQAAARHALSTLTGNRQPQQPTAPPSRLSNAYINRYTKPVQIAAGTTAPTISLGPEQSRLPAEMYPGAGQGVLPQVPPASNPLAAMYPPTAPAPPAYNPVTGLPMQAGGALPGLGKPPRGPSFESMKAPKIKGTGIGVGSMGNAMRGPASDPMKMVRRFSPSPERMLGRASPMRSMGLPQLAQGGPVPKPEVDDEKGDWYFKNIGTRTVPKSESGLLEDVADKSNPQVRITLTMPGQARDLTPEHMRSIQGPEGTGTVAGYKADKKQHGGPIRGRMSELLGGPSVPGSGAENPLPGAPGGKGKKAPKAAPMAFKKGGPVGAKKSSPVRGAGAVVRGVRPAKMY